jgi:hypothetical protein
LLETLLQDPEFHRHLLACDRDMADTARAAGCPDCKSKLHSARFPRAPRGVPAGLDDEYNWRFSFCCSADGCRARMTPPSLRFLGPKVWLATVVTLISAMQQGVTPSRAQRLAQQLGIHRRTLDRWRRWWLETFSGPFRKTVTAALMPPPAPDAVPACLLDRFAGDAATRLTYLLRFLAPLTGGRPTLQAF